MKNSIKKWTALCLGFGLTLGFATAGALTLNRASALEITQQPTGGLPKVETDAQDAAYQWYRMDKTFAVDLDVIPLQPFEDGTIGATKGPNRAVEETDGVWYVFDRTLVFHMAFEIGDVITVKLDIPREEVTGLGFPGLGNLLDGGYWQYDETSNTYTYEADRDCDSAYFYVASYKQEFSMEMKITRTENAETKTYPIVDAFGRELNGVRYVIAENPLEWVEYGTIGIQLNAGEMFLINNAEDRCSIQSSDGLLFFSEQSVYALYDTTVWLEIEKPISFEWGIYTLTPSVLEDETESALKNPVIGELYACEISDGAETIKTDIICVDYYIMEQPITSAPQFKLSYPDKLTYQWYEVGMMEFTLVSSATQEGEKEVHRVYQGEFEDGVWTGTEIDVRIMIEPNEQLIVKPAEDFAGSVKDYNGYYELENNGGVYTWKNTTDEIVDFNLYIEENTVEVEILLNSYALMNALEGETDSALQNYQFGGKYACIATSQEGEIKTFQSEVVAFEGDIVKQATAQDPSITVDYPEEVTGYQWYKYEQELIKVVDEDPNANERETSFIWRGNYEDGVWKADEEYSEINIFIEAEKGDALIVTPISGELTFVGPYDGESLELVDGKYVYILEENDIDLLIEGEGAVVEIAVNSWIPQAIAGENQATLPLCTAGRYACEVTFTNDRKVLSDIFNITEADVVHVWDEGAVTTEPTHTQFGVKTYTCECGETKTEEIAKTPEHNWNDGEITTPPTKKEAGEKTYTCECGETKTEEIPATKKDKGGCGAVILATSLSVVTLAGAGAGAYLVLRKRKEN